MRCDFCGNENQENTKYCLYCGNKLIISQNKEIQNEKINPIIQEKPIISYSKDKDFTSIALTNERSDKESRSIGIKKTLRCNNCGRELALGEDYCWDCGRMIDETNKKVGISRKYRGGSRVIFLVLFTLLLSVGGILLVVFGIQIYGNSEQTGTTMTTIGGILLVLVFLSVSILTRGNCFYAFLCMRGFDCDGDCDCR
ncbi:MAG: zinc ribbon domain-containing protein [Candidatus Lokiarchaeota archaeon]|nr:zinc ribbon domain-containing protein [Candidatus Lokiarchaeota archaeon]